MVFGLLPNKSWRGDYRLSTLADIFPHSKHKVIDLVREAGLDVSDWSNSRRGEEGASTNPKYCYEWAFAEPGALAVLNLWHAELIERDGAVFRIGNFREDSARNRQHGRGVWAARALRCDEALRLARVENLRVRVILNAGTKRQQGDPNARASVVTLRELDPASWVLAQYDDATGNFVLRRGAVSPAFIDQHDLPEVFDAPVMTRLKTGEVFARSAAVRFAVLARANGHCEQCGASGFVTASGSIYLETHHVVPLSEGGADSSSNVVALCPNDHRRAHYAADRLAFRAGLIAILSAPPGA